MMRWEVTAASEVATTTSVSQTILLSSSGDYCASFRVFCFSCIVSWFLWVWLKYRLLRAGWLPRLHKFGSPQFSGPRIPLERWQWWLYSYIYNGILFTEYVHVIRMDNTRIPKQVFYGQLHHGFRHPGGQYKRYKDCLKSTLTQCSITPSELETLAMDRTGWRLGVPHASQL